ncbi:hypothetical protein B9T07_26385 [Limnospira fusiformis CCALA 023]
MRMLRSAFLIFNQGVEILTRRLFRVLKPYFMPERLAIRGRDRPHGLPLPFKTVLASFPAHGS